MPTVSDLETSSYAVPNEHALDDATQSFHTLELVVCEVELDDGAEGMGFTYTIGEGADAVAAFLDSTLRPLVVGEPAAPRAAYRRMREGTTFVGREGVSELAISALDIALWDALGRRLGAPLYELLGGERRPVPAYQTDGGWLHLTRDELVANGEAAAERGFAGLKMKVGRGPAEDERRVRAVRDALPEDTDLMVDANCAFSVPEARRFAKRLDDVDLAWLEEPVAKGDYAAQADLRERTTVPIAGGENFYNAGQFAQALAFDALDVLQPDVARVGGVTAWARVAELAAAHGRPVSPHYVEPLHAHLACASDTVPYIENHSTVLDGVVADPPALDDGAFTPPTDPGHGIRFEGLTRYRSD
jgi:L-alanine-DL-glutamate epimerase-like enolase superfamily enzyme